MRDEPASAARRAFLEGAGALGLATALAPLAGARAAAATSPPELAATPTRTALLALLDVVRDLDARFVTAERGFTAPWQVAEGHRYLVHLVAAAHRLFLENDPERPLLVRLETPWRKFMGGNPDAYYFYAPIRGDRAYRIRGRHRGEVYRSVTTHGGKEEGGWGSYVVSHRNDRQYASAADGSYELVLAPARPDGVPESNWIPTRPDVQAVITRHYFLEQEYAPAAKGWEIPIAIEPVVDPGPRPEPTEASIERRLRAMASFVRDNTVVLFGPEEKLPSWFGRGWNRFGEPSFWGGADDGGGWGAVDNSYSSARYRLAPDEALVMRGRFPKCAFASAVLVNRWLQSYDFTQRRMSLNMRQTVKEEDGSFEIVVAHGDPGPAHPNWIDTGGRGEGQVDWRFQLPETKPEPIRTEVVRLAALRA